MKEDIKKIFKQKYLEKYPDKDFNEYQYYDIMNMLDDSLHLGLVSHATEEQKENPSSLENPLLSLMHDTAHDLDRLRDVSSNISRILKETKEPNIDKTVFYVYVEYIKTARKDIMDKLDNYYIKIKK